MVSLENSWQTRPEPGAIKEQPAALFGLGHAANAERQCREAAAEPKFLFVEVHRRLAWSRMPKSLAMTSSRLQ